MKEIRQIASVCSIIRDGMTVVNRAPMDGLSDAAIVEKMGQVTARQVEFAAIAQDPSSNGNSPEDTLVIRDADIEMRLTPGTVLGVAGAPAGPQALISALVGAAKTRRWLIARVGWPERFASPREAARNGSGFITGDRAHKGILANLPIIDNVMASRRIVGRSVFTNRREREKCLDLVQALKIKASSIWDLPDTLSGGTQQKLLLARWLGVPSRLLVLEEPTRGVDIGTKKEIYQLIRRMAASGTIIVWWSTENAELLEVCDRVVAFETDGRCAGIIERGNLSEDTLASMTGMAA
jgi:ribose transport system ATP-binding protein